MSTPTLLHAVCMTLMLILLISGIMIIHFHIGKNYRLKHRIINSTAVVLGIIAAIIMAAYKQVNGWPHFKSLHAKLGTITILLLIGVAVAGNKLLKGKTKLKRPHKILGVSAIVLILIAALLKI